MTETNIEVQAENLAVGDKLWDRSMAGTHGQRVEVQWIGKHRGRRRVYVAGVEERSRNPVTLGYDFTTEVKVFRT